MYEGENKTAQQSQRLIAAAMLQLLQLQPFGELRISDLCRRAGISRQTFYSLFGTKEAVLTYALRSACLYVPEQEHSACRSACFRDICRGYSRYIVANRDILELLVRNDLIHCLYDLQYECFLRCDRFLSGLEPEERQYLVDFIASGMSSIARNYVLTGCKADAAFLEVLMYRLFGGGFLMGDPGSAASGISPADHRSEQEL